MKKKTRRIVEKTLAFHQAMSDLYTDPENRHCEDYRKLEAEDGQDMTEDFLAMLLAMYCLYQEFADHEGEKEDLLGFTHILNRIAVNHIAELDVEDEREAADGEE